MPKIALTTSYQPLVADQLRWDDGTEALKRRISSFNRALTFCRPMPHVITSLVALSVAAFATTPTEAQHLTLVGEIHIKGNECNEPFPKVILETAAHICWELEGMSLNEARLVSRRQVTVHGVVIRSPAPGVWLPSVRVESPPQVVVP